MPTLRDQIGVLRGMGRDPNQIRTAMREAFDVEPAKLVDYLDDDVTTIPARLQAAPLARPFAEVVGTLAAPSHPPIPPTAQERVAQQSLRPEPRRALDREPAAVDLPEPATQPTAPVAQSLAVNLNPAQWAARAAGAVVGAGKAAVDAVDPRPATPIGQTRSKAAVRPAVSARDAIKSAMAESQAIREKRALDPAGETDVRAAIGNLGKTARNWGTDAAEFALSLAQLPNMVLGVVEDPTDQATSVGDAYQKGEAVGSAMVTGGAGDFADTVRGLADMSGSNVLLTRPLTAWTSVIQPGLTNMARFPGGAAAAAKVAAQFKQKVAAPLATRMINGLEHAVGRTPDAAIPTAWDDAKAAVLRATIDGIMQSNPNATAWTEAWLHGDESAVKNRVEEVARQIERGKVAPLRPELEPVELKITPDRAKGEAARAERVAGKAETAAGQAGGRLDAALQAAEAARDLGKGVRGVQRKAEGAEAAIARASGAADKAMEGALQAVSAPAERATAAVWEMADATLPVAEYVAASPLPKIAREEVQASRAAQAFEKAQKEYIAAARAAKEDPTAFAKQYAGMAAEEMGEAGTKLAGKQVAAMPTTEANAAAKAQQQGARAAKATVLLALKAYERANEQLAARIGESLQAVRRAGAQAAIPGVRLAEAVKPLDTETAPGMTREVASMQRQPARKAEREAAKAREAADVAGLRPTVAAGEVYLPPDHGGGGPPIDLDEADIRVAGNAAAMDTLEQAQKASAAKAAATEAGFTPDTVVPDPILAEAGIPSGATLYDAGKLFAEHLVGRNVDAAPDVLASQLEHMGGVTPKGDPAVSPQAAKAAADWLIGEVDLQAQARRVEPEFGAIRRPTLELKETTATPEGDIPPLAATASQGMQAALAGTPQRPIGVDRRAAQEWARMKSARLVKQPPAPVTSDNPIVNRAARDAAESMREAGYFPEEMAPGERVAKKPEQVTAEGEQTRTFNIADPAAFAEVEGHAKMLKPERIQQRTMEALEPDTMQLLRSRDVQRAALRVVSERAVANGYTGAARQRLLEQFARMIRDPSKFSAISKNRADILRAPDGTPLWTPDDLHGLVRDRIKPERWAEVQADVTRDIGREMQTATRTFQRLQVLNAETNRFRLKPDGKVIEATIGNADAYALAVAKGVLTDGAMLPQAMPFEGAKVAAGLLTDADKVAAELGVPVERVRALGRSLERMEPVGEAIERLLQDQYRMAFKGTQAAPDIKNLYLQPGVKSALEAQLFVESAAAHMHPALRLLQQVGQRGKKMVVAANVATLVNNDLSNFIQDLYYWGDPTHVGRTVLAPLKMKAYLDGKRAGTSRFLTAADERKYRALSKTNIIDGAQVSRDVGETRLWEAVGDVAPPLKRQAEAADVASGGRLSAAAGKLESVEDALVNAYTNLGDVPFRLGSAERHFDAVDNLVRMLEPGESITIPVSKSGTRQVVVERVDADTVRLTGTGGPSAKQARQPIVRLDGDELADVLAHYANVMQEKRYFDYSRIGNWGKLLRGGPMSLMSGVFAWFFKAANPAFLGEVIGGPAMLKSTSPKVQAFQRKQRGNLALRRAALNLSAQQSLDDQREVEDLARAASYSPSVRGAWLAASTDPRSIEVRNLEPLNFTQPIGTVLAGVGAAAEWLQYVGNLDDPEYVATVLNPNDEDVAAAVTDNANTLAAGVDLATMDPAQRAELLRKASAQLDRRREDLLRAASGETFSVKQALSLVGLGGGPLLSVLQRMQAAEDGGRPFGLEDAVREFSKQMFGATPTAAVNVGLGAVGQAGADAAGDMSTYGRDEARQGFRGGAPGESDQTQFLAWAIRQLTGIGWRTIPFESAKSPATGKQFMGRAKVYLQAVRKTLKDTFVTPAKERTDRAYLRYQAAPTKEREDEWLRAQGLHALAESVLRDEMKKMESRLKEQFVKLREQSGLESETDAPELEPEAP